MLSKTEFVSIIEKLKDHTDRIRAIEDAVGCVFDFDMLDCTVVELLEKMFDLPEDKYYGTTLSWWIYELDFGEKWHSDSLMMDGKPIDISTADKLYDFLLP